MLSLNEAIRVIRAAEDKAIQLGRTVNIAVVDAGGNPVANVRMDGAWLAGADMAAKKAYTSRAFDTATSNLLENTRPGGELAGLNFSGDRRIAVAPGGVPLRRHGRIEGAIGVSGCSASEDETIAMAGVRAFAQDYGDEEIRYNESRDYPQSREHEHYGYTPSQVERLGNRSAGQPQHYRQSMQ
jgi:uncharacterized protein GlcG (DUF336 family)